MITADNQKAVANLLNIPGFIRLMDDLEAERLRRIEVVINCPELELSQARADLKALTRIYLEIKDAPDTAKKIEENRSKQEHRQPGSRTETKTVNTR